MATLTREQLYALVWAEPIQRIAPRFLGGVRDDGVLATTVMAADPGSSSWRSLT